MSYGKTSLMFGSTNTFATSLKQEMQRRAQHHLTQKYLIADGYRIRRRLAFPWPLKRLEIPEVLVPGIPDYPWSVWLCWALEERIDSLGGAAHWFSNQAAQDAVNSDLWHLAQWPQYRQFDYLDLSLGHFARILAIARRQWHWLSPQVQDAIDLALHRIVANSGHLVEKHIGVYSSPEHLLAITGPHTVLHNIRLIGAIGATLAANAVNAPAKDSLNVYLTNAMETLLALREQGFTEGTAYDGYVLDFVMDWLGFLPREQQSFLLQHPQFKCFLEQSLWQSAPGDVTNVAELGDVEATRMTFHISAQAKAYPLQPLPERAWYLSQCRHNRLRAGALLTLYSLAGQLPAKTSDPESRATLAHYTVTLRSGWDNEDLAAVMTASTSPMGHVHSNNGTLAIGTQGQWFIGTPGNQQYIPNSERKFTLGVSSRNTPAINGQAQILKLPKVTALETQHAKQSVEIDLTACYSPELNLQTVQRRVQLFENRLIVVDDTIAGEQFNDIDYYWHGHPDAAWWVESDWARIHLAGKTLWLSSPQIRLNGKQLQRLRGSRGQLALVAKAPLSSSPAQTIRWYFLLSDVPPWENPWFVQFR